MPRPRVAPAEVAFETTEHDAGRVRQGERIIHSFSFANNGERPLRIDGLRAACDGTATLPDGEVIAPGARARVRLEIDTTDLAGPVRRTVTVYGNDPETPWALLVLTAEVDFDVAAEPPSFYLGRAAPGREVFPPVRLRLANGIRVRDIRSDSPRLRLRRTAPEEGEMEIHVSVADDASPGPLQSEIEVATNSTRRPTLSIPVRGEIPSKPRS